MLILGKMYELEQHTINLNYRVTRLLVQNLPLTSKVKFRFGLARPGQARPKRNFTLKSTGGFAQGDGSPCTYAVKNTEIVKVVGPRR